ncbi:MAG: hypothetical protein ACD_42C00499G0005 [uncultured bacterium]|nr:MAG: hypothetical protein ACD_42C00499G0005 [uncultured bacterium]OGT34619.1 MAG: hypothetical protein A3C44_07320 [Gammaproteobacteria bacterium RIFCSPHIGHO2_02_FULL_39_13]OGT50040.1 MAG: hypothetical protein A3E53_02425 [Gammaproteobacteria bacterium RIFCSPHIGHO2_12_FULL_39_24]
MLPEITQFVMKHWPLVGAFVIVVILLFIEEARSQGMGGGQVTPALAIQLINREEAVVIDLRDATAFRDGHIVNAKNIPLVDFDHQQTKMETYRQRYVILVDVMGAKTAAIAARLKKNGFEKVVSLKGGIDAWKTAGMPLVKK